MNKRPLSVTMLAWVYIGTGSIGGASHVTEFLAFPYAGLWPELIELLAIVSGAFMLRGRNWARWTAFAWISFHVILSAWHSLGEFTLHCFFCAVIGWLSFRPEAARYFRGARVGPV